MRRLFDLFAKSGLELYLVGGAVRDLARGVPEQALTDLDFATNASPQVVERVLHSGGYGTYKAGWAFGTVGTVLRGEPDAGYPKDVQITTYRCKEIYLPGSRHPEVHFGRSLEEDLQRRDLSINSMAMDAAGTIIDPFGGLADLEARRLRVVGDPELTLREDPLRVLRIGRFIAKLGFRPTERVRRAAQRAAASILDISRERWLMEMNKLLLGAHVAPALNYLQQTRVLGFILPELAATVGFDQTSEYHHKDVWQHTLLVVAQTPPRLAVRWAALLHDVGKVWTREYGPGGKVHFFRHEDMGAMLVEGIAGRFRFPNTLRQEVRFLVKHHLRANLYDGSWTESAVRRFNREMAEGMTDLLALSRADVTSANPARRQRALDLVEELERRGQQVAEKDGVEPLLPKGLGRLIMTHFSLSPGPRIGELRDLVEDAVLRGELDTQTPQEEMVAYLAGLDIPEARRLRGEVVEEEATPAPPQRGAPAPPPPPGEDADEDWEDASEPGDEGSVAAAPRAE